MIALALTLALAQAKPVSVTEVPLQKAGRMRVEILVGLDHLDKRDWAAANALRSSLAKGTLHFSRFRLLEYATMAGDPIRVTLAADHLEIGFFVPASDSQLAVELADELIREALLGEDDVNESLGDLPFRKRTPWSEAWLPLQVDTKDVMAADVKALYKTLFRPGNVWIAAGGTFPTGQPGDVLTKRFATWEAPGQGRRRYPDAPPSYVDHRSGALTTASIEGPTLDLIPVVSTEASTEPTLSEAMLACAMLGQGKGCTAFRILREKLGVSYQQEAFLQPAADGVRPNLVFGMRNRPGAKDAVEKAKAGLREAVQAWTEADRARALAFVQSSTDYDLGLGVLYFAQERALTSSVEDQTFLTAYWKMKTGRVWNNAQAASDMKAASLERARDYALAWLDKGSTRLIEGR